MARTLVLVFSVVGLTLTYMAQPIGSVEQGTARGLVDASRLRKHVEALTFLAPRTSSRVDNLDRAAQYVRDRFVDGGAETQFQEFTVGNKTFRNVIARLGPDTKEVVVVGAHYDAEGPGVGADDNASGVAGLLELAPLLRARTLPLRVELVAFTLEEPPHFRSRSMGSYVHADSLRKAGTIVRAMICLEMIGFFSDAAGSQRYPLRGLGLVYPTRADFIAVVGCVGQAGLVRRVKRAMTEATELPVWSMNAPRFVPGIDFSDHYNYWDAGFEAVMVTDTAFYRNAHYHEPTDVSGTLDYRRMALVVEAVLRAVTALSGVGE